MKNLSVLKFGGSSVATPDNMRRVATIVRRHKEECQNIVVVVSAMGDTTDGLIDLARQVSPNAGSILYRREMDMLLTVGERISMSLLSMALSDLDIHSRSFTGSQSGILTDSSHGEARIQEIKAFRIEEQLRSNSVVIVAGFQGVSNLKEITTLGRGGSDTSAVALGVTLNADDIYIYTDVSGFFSADPRLVPGAQNYRTLDTQLAYLAASRGSQVLHPRCLELAAKFRKNIWIKNTFDTQAAGTLIKEFPMTQLEGPVIKIISHQKDSVFLTARAPSTRVLKPLHDQGMRPQQVEWNQGQLSFVLPTSQVADAKKLLNILKLQDTPCISLSLLGYGFESHPELSEKVLEKIPENLLLSHKIDAISINLILKDTPDLKSILVALHTLMNSKHE